MKKLLLIYLFLPFISCNSGGDSSTIINPTNNNTTFNWTVATSDITGSDNPFPLALNPSYSLAKNVDFINDSNKVALISFSNGEVWVYPYNYISTYEIINDEINGNSFSLTYCPITESAVLFKRNFKGIDSFILRSSGYLYKENLVAIDQKTNTYWSQFLLKSIKGKYQNQNLETLNLIETNWKTVHENFPDAFVFTNTSVQNSKNSKASLKTSIDSNEVVYGILEDETKNELPTAHIYQYQSFTNGIVIKNGKNNSDNIVIIGSNELQFITSFKVPSNRTFTAIQNSFPNVMMDSEDNVYNVFGIAVSGPDEGSQLSSPDAFFASFWAWESFYPSIIEES
jgi:hypothetical protein